VHDNKTGTWNTSRESTLMTFDDISGYVGDQYAGVHFSPGWNTWNSSGNIYYPPYSNPNIALTHELDNWIIWDEAQDHVSFYANCFRSGSNSFTFIVISFT
jgi:hypothetical protein